MFWGVLSQYWSCPAHQSRMVGDTEDCIVAKKPDVKKLKKEVKTRTEKVAKQEAKLKTARKALKKAS